MILSRRRLLALSAAASLSGCGAVSAVSKASAPLDTYTLSPLAPLPARGAGSGHLVVELPTTGGELAGDRILIKVSPTQAEYLPDARWSEPVPAMVQTLLVNAVLNQGGFRLVSRVGAGLMPDYTVMTEIQALQADLRPAPVTVTDGLAAGRTSGAAGIFVRVMLQMTVIRETDRAIVATRRFEAGAEVPSDATPALVASLDGAMLAVLAEATDWLRRVT